MSQPPTSGPSIIGTRRTMDWTPMPMVCWRLVSEVATTAKVVGSDKSAPGEEQKCAEQQRQPMMPHQHKQVAPHMFHSTRRVNGTILWANLHLLFWLSLFPFTTGWMGENHLASMPAAVYGFVLLMAAIAYYVLQRAIIAQQGPDSLLASAIGSDWKGKLSPVLYLSAMLVAFVSPWIAVGLYWFGALMWLVPDRRIERVLANRDHPT